MTRPGCDRQGTVLVAIVAAALLVACSGDPEQPTAQDRELDRIEESVADRCEQPPVAVIDTIADRLTVDARLEHPRAVGSNDEAGLYFVAAEVVGEELDDEPPIAAWAALGELEHEPEIVSVNAVARYLSDWPDGTRSPHRLTMEVAGGEASEECVEAAAK